MANRIREDGRREEYWPQPRNWSDECDYETEYYCMDESYQEDSHHLNKPPGNGIHQPRKKEQSIWHWLTRHIPQKVRILAWCIFIWYIFVHMDFWKLTWRWTGPVIIKLKLLEEPFFSVTKKDHLY